MGVFLSGCRHGGSFLIFVQMETKKATTQTSDHGGPRLSRFRPVEIVALWLVAVMGGSAAMLRYEFTRGDPLHVQSEGTGRGATFTIELPISPNANTDRRQES